MDNSINKRIATLRVLKNLTQADFANCLGIKPNTYSRKEKNGIFKPDELSKIAALLGVSISELFNENNSSFEETDKENAPETPVNTIRRLHQPSPFGDDGELIDDFYPLTPQEKNTLKIIRNTNKKNKDFLLSLINTCYASPKISEEKKRAIMELLEKP